MITDEQFKLANQRAKKKISNSHVTTAVHYDNNSERITISLSSGLELSFSPKTVQGLENAKPADLTEIEISPSGLGLYFPKVDTDLYIPSLLHGLLAQKNGWLKMDVKGAGQKQKLK